MNHLLTTSLAFRHIQIFYVFDENCFYIYDNANIETWIKFSERCEWSVLNMTADNFDYTCQNRNTFAQATSMLQAWLYFEMIQLITTLLLVTKDYIRVNHHDQRIVITEKLLEHLEKYKQVMSSVSEKDRSRIIEEMNKMLKL